jgi:hypothetical protein
MMDWLEEFWDLLHDDLESSNGTVAVRTPQA